jgi:uncharacterized membrane protein
MIAIPFILKRIGFFLWDNWKLVLGAIVLLVIVVFVYRACSRPPKLNEAEIQKGEQAVKERNDKALKEILAASDVREQGIDNSIQQAEDATEKAKRNYEGWSNEDLAAELERRRNQ